MQPRILYPTRLSLRIDGETRTFQDRQKLKEFVTTKPALHEILRGGFYKIKKAPREIQNRNLQSGAAWVAQWLSVFLQLRV